MSVPEFIVARRSIRAFASKPVDPSVLAVCIEAATLAPAPHHSKPWRFVSVTEPANKRALAHAMGDAWRVDLLADGDEPSAVEDRIDRSIKRLCAAPALVLGCVTADGLDTYPDAERQRAEFGMALLSLGAAIENLMLTATELGLASCWLAAPIFCSDVARTALALPEEWHPQALVCLGYADVTYTPRTRPATDLDVLWEHR
jgi:coenzyme F420-0:L-glutamate ligase/coenzyme F420-1:gamma-L-glutamate ligase